MPAVSQKIPNLLGGVSQQPDPVKLPGQVRVADNVYLDPTFGCRKRPSTRYTNRLASNVPANAKWFPIFRDGNERYAVAIYQSETDQPVCRVWDLNNGVERSVTISDFSRDYLAGAGRNDIDHLTVADYTLLTNKNAVISMSGEESDGIKNEAFVIINQVTYNTTYSIDVLKEDTDLEQVKIYKATSLEVSPGSYESPGGSCDDQSITPFEINDGSKQGLRGEVTIQCTPFLRDDGDDDNDQDSRYTLSVSLKNGGVGFRKGDQYTVSTPSSKTVRVRVASESFTYGYKSSGTANYTSPLDAEAGTLSVTDITAGLVTAVNGLSGFSADFVGNVIRIRSNTDEEFNVAVRGGSTNRAMLTVKGTAQNIAELPSQGFDGSILKVTNTEDADSDDYYVRFSTKSEGIPGTGSWVETVAPNIKTTLNSASMPQALIRQPDGSFTLEPLNSDSAFEGWGEREVGDATSNPTPSFVGKSITNMFFYANRMGVLTNDTIVMSQPGDYFNFFVESALTVSDADPIDLTASSTKPAFLKGAIGSNKGLILFAETSQFLLASTEIAFAASTVKMTEISNYYYKSQCPLLNTGVSVIFTSESDTYSKAMEMAIDSVENRPQVAEITKNVPEFLPTGLLWGESMPNNSMAVFGDDGPSIYIFKFLNNGGERQLAGWSTWTYPADVVMFGSEDDLMYTVMFDGVNHILVKSELTDDPKDAPLNVGFSSFSPRLDLSVDSSTLTITDDPNSTLTSRVYVPEEIYLSGAEYTFISTDGGFKGLFTDSVPEMDDSGNPFIVVSKDLTAANAVLGIGYNTVVELPAIFVTQEGRADRVNIPQVSFLYLELYYSGRYEVTINKLGYDTKVYDIEVTPANSYDANNVPLAEISTESIPIFSSGDILNITIKSPDPFPSAITGYSWEGTYHTRGIRAI